MSACTQSHERRGSRSRSQSQSLRNCTSIPMTQRERTTHRTSFGRGLLAAFRKSSSLTGRIMPGTTQISSAWPDLSPIRRRSCLWVPKDSDAEKHRPVRYGTAEDSFTRDRANPLLNSNHWDDACIVLLIAGKVYFVAVNLALHSASFNSDVN